MAGSAEFKLEIQGIKGLSRALRQYPKIAHPILQRAFVASQAAFAKHTLKENPVPWKTGNLLQSFRFRVGELQARWFPTANYAPYVEFGTGIYGPKGGEITPKSGKVLSWEVGGQGQYVASKSGKQYYKKGAPAGRVYARSVKGMRARPYMQAILDNSKDDVLRLFVQAGKMINDQIGKEALNS